MSLRSIPSVSSILQNPVIKSLVKEHSISQEYVTLEIRAYLEHIRVGLKAQETDILSENQLIKQLELHILELVSNRIVPLINATGIVLHTNLGRALLPKSAETHLLQTACKYSNLEYNLSTGERGSRHDILEKIITMLTGAEAAMIVNNNASAVFLILREFAAGKEVVVSRGEIVEIGGSFRISDIMLESGAILREIGTSNRTHMYDYEKVINENTAMLLKVHKSNFAINGFTKSVTTQELVKLAHNHDLLVYEDLGSGVLYDLKKHGIGKEPSVKEVVSTNIDLVSFSGDKLLGGPQAGIIVGKRSFISRLKKNPLARVLRVDKLTIAALESTFQLYLDEDRLIKELPTLRDILISQDLIYEKALKLYSLLLNEAKSWCTITQDVSEIGGGTMPEVELPTYVLAFKSNAFEPHHLQRRLRLYKPAIIARIKQDSLIFDLRTIQEDEILIVADAVNQLVNRLDP